MSTRYVLGLGGTVDYEIDWDPGTLERLAAQWGLRADELDARTPVLSERDLLRSLLGFVRDGVGGERFVASSEIVEAFARRFPLRVTLGGTCVRAAIAMDRVRGLPALVHLVSIDDDVRRLLPASTTYLCSADRDTTDPHLIVQYPAGSAVRVAGVEVVASRPNRLIYVNDPPNRELVLHPALGDACATADVVLVSGFNVIQERETLDARLATLAADLDRVPPGGFVYFEDAGYHLPALRGPVRDVLAPRVDVWAVNEDELQEWTGRAVDLLDAADVAKALGELHAAVPARTLVVHTQHWALAAGAGASGLRAALRGGIDMASTRYVHGDSFTPDDYAATAARTPGAAGTRFAGEVEALAADVACEPAYVLDVPRPTTIGLGDTFVGGFLAALATA
ncbi:ADP-dependent glucokinase/phosphofructokinase [Cellulomonas sp. ES6]|uniref:ADP-dependent glucokinase/phosphofructokinase n=1 Tax=Cellulomonas sp. ES6 TaxID=3039384 RepID=UPI0024B785DA|nr:ADP-dependent glucokinase/phosphofructokinase [Cellulomonas sp. ES6]WHP16245.1 ADP-dependent glucokinase/phosphofructokinase [Cellulomonas sp. ES6]